MVRSGWVTLHAITEKITKPHCCVCGRKIYAGEQVYRQICYAGKRRWYCVGCESNDDEDDDVQSVRQLRGFGEDNYKRHRERGRML